MPFASSKIARTVQFAELSTRAVSTIGHEERLVLAVKGQPSSTIPTSMSINGVPAEEVNRRALSDGLFGTRILDQAALLAQPIDPLEHLRGGAIDDSIIRPVARLLFAERLLAGSIASTVDSFVLGPSHQGRRRLRAAWTPPLVYTNGPDPVPVSIDGVVTGL